MVAIIKTGYSIRRSFFYNDNKVNENVAKCISAVNYPMELAQMGSEHRLNMLLKTAARNEAVKRNSVHISLNFSPSENLNEEKLKQIADEYMEAIGFGEQPYLVYQHYDAGHPHIHIVSCKVRHDGTRVETQNIGRKLSEPARKQIEIRHGLVKAEDRKQHFFRMVPVSLNIPGTVKRVEYGKTETKRAIQNVLDSVLEKYKYTSLPQLNAVLNLYNIHADLGSETSRIRYNRGLVYRILDEHGKPVGVPLKASLFHQRRIWKYLDKKFLFNKVGRDKHKQKLKQDLDLVFFKNPSADTVQLSEIMRKNGIDMILRHSNEGRIFGVTFVDHRSKQVFNGSELGKAYSANAIQYRNNQDVKLKQNKFRGIARIPRTKYRGTANSGMDLFAQTSSKSLLQIVTQPEVTIGSLPASLKRRRRKKRKKRVW